MGKKKTKKKKLKIHNGDNVKFGKNTVSIEELTKQVNEMDKEFGIHLKNPDIWSEPEKYREIIRDRIEMNICRILCIVNGIDETIFLYAEDEDDDIGVGVRYREFTDESYLDWYDDKTCYDTDSLMFRCRFISFVLEKMLGRIKTIAEREVKVRYNLKHSLYEKEIIVMRDIYEDIIRFTLLMINTGNVYENSILRMTEHVNYGYKRFDHRELQSILNSHVLTLRNGMERDKITFERFFDDDMGIFNILKISYMLSTGKTNVKCLPEFIYIENATVKHDLIKLIEALGEEVVKARKLCKMTPMFAAFLIAKPAVFTQYNKEIKKSYPLKMGFMALAYTKFVIDSKTMNKFINEMMKKGI